MSTLALLLLLVLGLGAVKLLFVPASLIFELRERFRRPADVLARTPLLSVIVPGYNEETVLENCVASILASDYPNFEVILVNDGSTDNTGPLMARLAASDPRILHIDKPNGGKGSALNLGLAAARGEFILCVDSDGIFGPRTMRDLLGGFHHEKVGAVGGDDRPVNLDNPLTCLLALISHVGTGFIRRALALLHCMPVVSGNVGAFRRSALDVTGPFRTDSLGEDLELTWRMHRAGFDVGFVPRAIVYAESPSTLKGLWRQRVRWARGLIQTTWLHRDMIANPRFGMFGLFLLFNTLTMIAVPFIQTGVLIALPFLPAWRPADGVAWLGYLGVGVAVGVLLYSIALNGAWADLRHLWTLPAWPLYAVFVGFTVVRAMYLEISGAERAWGKLTRTGVISISAPGKEAS
ncbi:MAG: glycosyltransferase family 2 protein [Corynebacterium sp.]|uniref:glycosyltransferase n=1 Tax=Corynebacterium sp. TaxID=1720 RepID=UPI0026DFF77A|nr:glycosyltransferase family 2 protein [Corynebacterium sp.]MDO5670134.1 glycosyltransferase family 2 protein [Corynebacterium sp.]